MAKGLVLDFEGAISSFAITKVDREKLYGRKERVVVDETGAPSVPAYLTPDGRSVVPPGGVAYVYVDEQGTTIERAGLRAVDAEGVPLPLIASTLGVAQPLVGPVDPSHVLDHAVTTVYQLHPEAVSAALLERLAAGDVFETRFNYREDHTDSPAFVLGNEHGLFALIARPHEFALVNPDAPPPAHDDGADDDADGDLDFSMM